MGREKRCSRYPKLVIYEFLKDADRDSETNSRLNITALELKVRPGAISVVSLCQFAPRVNMRPAKPS